MLELHSDSDHEGRAAGTTQHSQARLEFLVEAGTLLASSLDFEETLRNIARIAVPRLADWCAIYRLCEDGEIERLIVTHHQPEKIALLEALVSRFPATVDRPQSHERVIRTGRPELVHDVTDEMLRIASTSEEHLALLRQLELGSALTVPLFAREHVWGAIALGNDLESERLDEWDLRLATELAARAGATIHNALLVGALRESEERLRLVSESVTNHAIITLTPDGRIDGWNAGAERIFGYAPQEVMGHDGAILFLEEDRARGVPEWELGQAITTGRAGDDRWMRHRDGASFFANGVTTPLLGDHDELRGFVKVLRDVTEGKLIEEELMRAKEQAEEASRAKSQFLATLSHELRTPLTPILTSVQALADDRTLSEENRMFVDIIGRNVEMEKRLIDDLLDVTRIVSGKLQLNFSLVDVHEVVGNALEVCWTGLHARHQHLNVALDADTRTVRADPARLEQVFWNLLTNAIKFTPERGLISIVSSNTRDGSIRVEVRDSGIGIPPDLLPRIFDVFEQGDVAVTKRFGGLGLGLSITRAIVGVHGGTISVESEGLGHGAAFIVELPIATTSEEHGAST
jgi:PAS domain S-box-containing protein